jgi:2-polyprenyl-6-methoxyphenol hydroxylase-like FAD-dependent oxidoreductase
MHTPITYDVIVSGAGPVGLFLASELALAGCTVLILERADSPHSPLKQLPFGIRGLSAPTIEALHRRGMLPELEVHKVLKNPHKSSAPGSGAARQGGHFAGIPFLDGNVDAARWSHRLPSSTATNLITSMQEIESVLGRRAAVLGVQIDRGIGVTDWNQAPDGVTVQSGARSFRGKWLVGCDGSRSVVRKAGSFLFAGTEPEFTGYSAQIDIATPAALQTGRIMTATGMYLQSQPGYLVMIEFDGGAGHAAGPLTFATVQETLRRVSQTGVTLSALHAVTTWTDRARQATSYRDGRVLLAGDAAHIHSPLGGQGLNLGLGDAMNLGWKLAAAVQDRAPPGLLDSYQSERHPLGVRVLDWSRAQVAIMKPDPASRALQAVVRDLIATCDGATYFAGRVWGVDTHYDLGGAHPLTGHGVPNFEFEDGKTIGDLMHAGKATLLDFRGSPSLGLLAGEYGNQMQYVDGRTTERFGLSAALVRPDGIVAWASDAEPDCDELRAAASRWLMAHPA